MQFVIIAKDGNDAEALNRRMAARPAHLAECDTRYTSGEQKIACALLNEAGEMHGTVMVVDFESREALDTWLKTEPYILGNVWQDVQILPCKISPAFLKK